MPQWRFDGAFSVKQPRPQYIFVEEDGDVVAIKFNFFLPGVARVSFHNVEPYEPGENEPELEARILHDDFRDPPDVAIFGIYQTENGEPDPNPIQPLAQAEQANQYEIMWANDYLIKLRGIPYRRLVQQHQSARKRPEPLPNLEVRDVDGGAENVDLEGSDTDDEHELTDLSDEEDE